MVSLAFLIIIVILWINAAGLITEGFDLVSSKHYKNDVGLGILYLLIGSSFIAVIFFMLYWLGKALI